MNKELLKLQLRGYSCTSCLFRFYYKPDANKSILPHCSQMDKIPIEGVCLKHDHVNKTFQKMFQAARQA